MALPKHARSHAQGVADLAHERRLRRNSAPFAERHGAGKRTSGTPKEPTTRDLLVRSGYVAKNELDTAAGDAGGFARWIGGQNPSGGDVGTLVAYFVGSVLTLLVLDLLLSDRGAGATSAIEKWTGGAIKKLASPTDPLIAQGPATSPAAATASGSAFGPGGAYEPVVPGVTPPPTAAPTPTGKLVPDPGGSGKRIDKAYASTVGYIESAFGVKAMSLYRTPSENALLPGAAKDSDHLRGAAGDFVGPPAAMARLHAWASKLAAAGVFAYVEPMAQAKDHVHISFWRK